MTNLMNITIFVASLLISGYPSLNNKASAQEANLYCSDSYHFCAKFPASILTNNTALPQEKGIILKSEDGFSEVILAGYSLPENTDTKSLFLVSASKKAVPAIEPKVISSIFGEDFYECYFLIDRHYYYHQCYLFSDYFVRVEIKVPINMPDKLQVLQQQIRLDFGYSPILNKTPSSNDIGGLRD